MQLSNIRSSSSIR